MRRRPHRMPPWLRFRGPTTTTDRGRRWGDVPRSPAQRPRAIEAQTASPTRFAAGTSDAGSGVAKKRRVMRSRERVTVTVSSAPRRAEQKRPVSRSRTSARAGVRGGHRAAKKGKAASASRLHGAGVTPCAEPHPDAPQAARRCLAGPRATTAGNACGQGSEPSLAGKWGAAPNSYRRDHCPRSTPGGHVRKPDLSGKRPRRKTGNPGKGESRKEVCPENTDSQ